MPRQGVRRPQWPARRDPRPKRRQRGWRRQRVPPFQPPTLVGPLISVISRSPLPVPAAGRSHWINCSTPRGSCADPPPPLSKSLFVRGRRRPAVRLAVRPRKPAVRPMPPRQQQERQALPEAASTFFSSSIPAHRQWDVQSPEALGGPQAAACPESRPDDPLPRCRCVFGASINHTSRSPAFQGVRRARSAGCLPLRQKKPAGVAAVPRLRCLLAARYRPEAMARPPNGNSHRMAIVRRTLCGLRCCRSEPEARPSGRPGARHGLCDFMPCARFARSAWSPRSARRAWSVRRAQPIRRATSGGPNPSGVPGRRSGASPKNVRAVVSPENNGLLAGDIVVIDARQRLAQR